MGLFSENMDLLIQIHCLLYPSFEGKEGTLFYCYTVVWPAVRMSVGSKNVFHIFFTNFLSQML